MKTRILAILMMILMFIFIAFPGALPVSAMGKISDGSGVANIQLEGMTEEEARNNIQDAVVAWYEGNSLLAENEYETVEIPRNVFSFNIDATFAELEQKMERTWKNFFRKPKDIMIPLHVFINEERVEEVSWPETMDVHSTLDKLLFHVSNLESGQVILEYKEDAVLEEDILAEVAFDLPEASLPVIERVIDELDGTIITSETVFSFIEQAYLPNGIDQVDAELSYVATAIYQLALQTNLEVIERHQMEAAPNFTEPGLEAAIHNTEEKNLLIYNPNEKSYTFHAEIIESQLQMHVSSIGAEEPIQIERQNIIEVEPRTIYRYSPDLAPNEEIVEREGSAGLQLEVYQEFSINGEQEKVIVSRDYYPPEHRVILTSTVTEEEIAEEELTPTPEEVSDFFANEFPNDVIPDGVTAAIECDGDSKCEEEYGVTTMDRMIASCFVDGLNMSSDGEATYGNLVGSGICDSFFTALFLNMLSDDPVSEDEFLEEYLTDEDYLLFPTDEIIEETEEADEEVVVK